MEFCDLDSPDLFDSVHTLISSAVAMNPTNPLAPCVVDIGTIVRKRDMHRLLSDLGRVYYWDMVDQEIVRSGEAYVMEVFADSTSATMIANASVYLNVYSFDCLVLGLDQQDQDTQQAIFDLIQENRTLRLRPLSNPLLDPPQPLADAQALKMAMVDWFNHHATEEDEDCADGFSFN